MTDQKTLTRTVLNGLIAVAALVACATLLLALRAFAEANMGLKLSKDPRMLASTTGILGALLLGGLGLLAMLVVALALVHHTETIRGIANRVALDQAVGTQVTDSNWKQLVEQVVADVLDERVKVLSFADMDASSVAWIRFVINRDHGANRIIVFATSRRVMGCKGWGRAIRAEQFPQAAGELRAIWNHFSGKSEPVSLPRTSTWFVLPLQTAQDKKQSGLRTQLASFLQKPVLAWLRPPVER